MFGINDFSQVEDILEGHYNELVGKEQDLSERRMNICTECPLFTDKFGGICDSKKCFDTNKKELVSTSGKGIICGCGCRLQAKTKLPRAKCVLSKW